MPETIKIFISSPSDVRPERLIAERVIARLDREFSYHFRVEAVLWEHEPLVASHHFQDSQNILPPRTTDIVVVILWSRLGVLLPHDRFTGAVSGKAPVTGTEWEFEDALAGYREVGTPNLLLYRKQAPITASLDDEALLDQSRKQKRLVETFLQDWFHGAGGTFAAASTTFSDETAFEEKLEGDLRKLLLRQLENRVPAFDRAPPATIRWHEGSPFRGLESFELRHAPVFFGRTRARNELRGLLARRAEQGRAFVLVMGPSGSGKSSLVKAGLLPDLLLSGMVGNVGLCRHAVLRPSQTGGDPLAALADAIMAPSALPELADLKYTPERLRGLLQRDHDQAAFAVEQGLARAAEAAKLTHIASARLVLIIDQMEEIFTIEGFDDTGREAFVASLAALAASGHVWIVSTMRSDFFDRLAALPALAQLSDGEGRYLLSPPTEAEIGQIIRQPAREAGVVFEANLAEGHGLDDVILTAAARDPDSLPLLEFLLDQLWQRRKDGTLTFAAYEEIGRLEGALARRAQEEYERLPPEVQAALPSVLRGLVTVGQEHLTVATARHPYLASFEPGSAARRLVERFSSTEVRLFVIDGERVRLAHEALLTHWPLAARLIGEAWEDLQLRARLEQPALRWGEASPSDREGFLLRAGLPLAEAEDLLLRRSAELDPVLRDFIAASSNAVHSEERRRVFRLRATVGVSSAAAVIFLFLGVFAAINWYDAKRSLDAAAVAITNFVQATSEFVQPIAQLDTVQVLVDQARDAIDSFSDVTSDPRLSVQRARTLLILAEIEEARGRLAPMRKDAEEAFTLLDPIAGKGGVEARIQRARSERLIGLAFAQAGAKDEARAHYERAIADINDLRSGNPGIRSRPDVLLTLAELYQYLGDIDLNQFNDPNKALAAYTASYDTRVELRSSGFTGPKIDHDIAWAANKLGDVQVRLENDGEAFRWFTVARRGIEGLADNLWDNILWPHHLVLIGNNMGIIQTRRGRYRDAVASFQDAQRILSEVIKRDPKNTIRISALGWSYDIHGEALYRWAAEERDAERLALARATLAKALAIRMQVAETATANKLLQLGVVNTRANLAMTDGLKREWDGDYAGAATAFEQAAELVTETYTAYAYQYARQDGILRIMDLVDQAVANYLRASQPDEARRVLMRTREVVRKYQRQIEETTYANLDRRIQRHLDSLNR